MGVSAEDGKQRIGRLMAQLGGEVDALLCMSPENIYFLTGFRTMLYTRFAAAVVRFDEPDPPALVASSVDRALVTSRVWSPPWTERVVYHGTHPDVAPTPQAAVAPLLQGVRRLGVDSIKLVDAAVIEQACPGVRLVNVAAQIDSVKVIKTPVEVSYLRAANRIAMEGIGRAQALVASGPTTELEVAVELDGFARRQGADGFGYPTLVSCGVKMLAAHSPALARPVERGLPLRIAYGPMVEWYTADVVRTVCAGEPPAQLRRLQDGYLAARDAIFGRLRPGVTSADLLEAAHAEYARRDLLGYWRNSIGHGVGLSIHESPRLGAGSKDQVLAGMVLAIEPALSVAGFGGYAQCDVVHMTDDGFDLLTPGLQGLVLAG
ncbi:MAG TPA: Xaa-Pro peptidase family protein [bacterium]|nr:Xaa-Pro peptidase family protein [bacterium]